MSTNHPFIVAEIAQGYDGSSKLVELFVKAASSAGADAIKFQIFYADELALPDYEFYRQYKGLELPLDVWEKAVTEAHSSGMEFYSDVFGFSSFRDLERLGVDGYKIHATDVTNTNVLKLVAGSGKKVLLSTGGCLLDEIDNALKILSGCKVTLMYGFQAEPTPLADNNLARIKKIISLYGKPVGFQDHTAGGSPYASYVSFMSLGLGVGLVEKHLTLSRAAQMEDSISALTPEEFSNWVETIKQLSCALGRDKWELSESELRYRAKVKRAVCTATRIAKGDILGEEQLTLKRSGNRNAVQDISAVIGKTACKDIGINVPIEKGDLE